MPEYAFNIGITELLQQPMRRIGVTVNVANEIVSLFDQSPPSLKKLEVLNRQLPLGAIFGLYISGSEPS